MRQRNFSYDLLPQTISVLNEKLGKKKDVIKKAADSLKLTGKPDPIDVKDVNEATGKVDALCKLAYSQFLELREDYRAGHIQPLRYRDYLAKFKELLTDREEKIVNQYLHADEISKEIQNLFFAV